ncbi:hypothetical protein HO133_000847 [Letharia lupina]|uniref:alpha-1,2-Mannosidase n=1 Tax=Letharia lupina TaxID=560253 RepID=A0A8H6FCF8_9LECA|nr:uncharacterized protein HO133_000847 [Letharia lupina]KAF6222798.1 hypothetical protein HO133_000847 [Letharia lupina]
MRLSSLSQLSTAASIVYGHRLPFPSNPEYQSLALRDQTLRAGQNGGTNSMIEQQRAAAVKDAFTFAWNGYFTTCKGQDELEPVTNTCTNPRNNWGASAVDALSTALVMESQSIVNDILDYIATIDYTTTATEVSLFETTIRYMAGMLSGYDLLKGPLSSLGMNASAVDTLLTQSKSLADSLSFAFNTSTGIPSNSLYFTNQTDDGSTTNGLADIGTLCLEWQHLSDLTGDPSYGDLAQKAETYLLNPLPGFNEPFAGLVGTNVNISNGVFLDATGGWNGGDDSFYEYLIKMYVYDSSRYSNYSDRWVMAADSTIKYLTSNPASRPDLTFLASYVNTTFVNSSEHLTCFDGGNFLLGGSVLGRQDYIEFGLALVNGCHDLYNSTLTGIGPESFSWNTTGVDSTNEAFYNANGFYITDQLYDLRPEVIESFYYAYRITGNTMYQDWAWEAFVAINATTRVGQGFSEISNVNAANGGSFDNVQESFLFAEVMKYSYLIHAPDSVFQVAGNGSTNQFVFNTEAHPLKVVGPPV